MKIHVLLLVATLFAISASAQTKKIAHRSHSGSDVSFSPTADEDNFGIYIKPDTSRHVVTASPPADTGVKPAAASKQKSNTQSSKTKKRKKSAGAKTK